MTDAIAATIVAELMGIRAELGEISASLRLIATASDERADALERRLIDDSARTIRVGRREGVITGGKETP